MKLVLHSLFALCGGKKTEENIENGKDANGQKFELTHSWSGSLLGNKTCPFWSLAQILL